MWPALVVLRVGCAEIDYKPRTPWFTCAEPHEHQTIDLWALFAMPSISTQRAKAVESLLKRKFADGLTGTAWLKTGLHQHEVVIPRNIKLYESCILRSGPKLECLLAHHARAMHAHVRPPRPMQMHISDSL